MLEKLRALHVALRDMVRGRLARPEPFELEDLIKRNKYKEDYAVVAGSLMKRLSFESVYDVGCANGFMLRAFMDAGKLVGGIDASPAVMSVLPELLRKRIVIGDFVEATGRWELGCCVEVAEHIRPTRSVELVRTIARIASRWIYFTAAPPGQPGHGHINCRPHWEWLKMFEDTGWRCDWERTYLLREDLSVVAQAAWLQKNSFILRPCPSDNPYRALRCCMNLQQAAIGRPFLEWARHSGRSQSPGAKSNMLSCALMGHPIGAANASHAKGPG